MTKTNKRWTKEEEEILVQAVKANPHNLTQCFKEVASKIDRSVGGIAYHWYAVLGNPQNKKYVGTSFLVIGRNTYAENRKITATGYKTVSSKRKATLWQKIKNLIFHK